ncbi:[FeFe] hydrogenase H-cluster radical SAM maturase HydE [Aedoeadaptatus urinae]|uniref:[FeFe] hydrogenase H-cluster radical SAM maturase HydE n=1 Tax=Aedoeadaptatus urinae TaxID=1871017 RepID=UPI00190EA190|nr:[FeFe] hydrogenase H-cluster radical SAM maturase HydE [Peptoniphilus urinae]
MIETIFKRIDEGRGLDRKELRYLLENREDLEEAVFEKARAVADRHFHKKIYVRGLIEFTNYCHNNCYYCGIRRGNDEVDRYRLTTEEMEAAVAVGAQAGFQTFVLQGGEDAYFTDERLADWLRRIKRIQPGCAITLSVGERSRQSYARLKEAGADRFLLRHETYDPEHYKKLHPKEMDRDKRLACLYELKALGYQVGSGFMVGSPYQSTENLVEDFMFLQKLQPAMIGIGPYVRHHATPFRDFENGSVEITAMCIAILRLLFPTANIPSTTAMQTLAADGRNRGILAGANVFMPNLSPPRVRESYALYDNKAAFALEAAENLRDLKAQIAELGYEIVMSRGDFKGREI